MNHIIRGAWRRFGIRTACVLVALLGMAGQAQAQSCPAGKVEQAGLCYDPPRSGYSCTGVSCMKDCPDGYSASLPGFCHYNGSTSYSEKPFGKKHESTPHKCLASYYANCRSGYQMTQWTCGTCVYTGAWDVTRATYWRAAGVAPDFTQVFNHLGSTLQATYGQAIGTMQAGYYAAYADVQKLIDAATLQLFHTAAKKALGEKSSDGIALAAAMNKTLTAFKASTENPADLANMKRILGLVASKSSFNSAEVKDIAETMLALSGKYGLLCGPGKGSNFPSNMTHSSGGIYAGVGGAYVAGVDASVALIHNCQLDADGYMNFAVVSSTGGSVGYAFLAGAGVGLLWSPGPVDQQGGAYVGLMGAADVGMGFDSSISWSVAKGMSGAQNAIPGISAGTGVGAGVQLSLSAGYSMVLTKFSYKASTGK